MNVDPESIAKISSDGMASTGFLGTGFLVTPDHVVTCAHVISDRPGDWPEWEGGDESDAIGGLQLHFGNSVGPDARRTGKVIARDRPDLALIKLDRPVVSQPLPLVSGLRAEHKTAFSRLDGSVIGFSQTESGTLVERPVDGEVLVTWDFRTREMLSIHVIGGLSPGMSGSPLMVESGKLAVCFGMAHLGGAGAALSRLIVSQLLLDFLTQNGISPRIVPANSLLPHDLPGGSASAKRWFKKVPVVLSLTLVFIVFAAMSPPLVQAPDIVPVPTPSQDDSPEQDVKFLSDEQVQSLIRNALKNQDVKKAVRLLSGMRRGKAKADECEHLYGFTKNDRKLNWATTVVNQCWKGNEKKEKLSEIATAAISE